MADVIDIDEKPRKSTPGHGGRREGAGRRSQQNDAYTLLAKAKAKRETYRANLAELEYKEKSGELVNVAEVTTAWEQQIQIAKGRFLALPARLAPEIVRCKKLQDAQMLLQTAINDVLTEMADQSTD